MDYSYEITATNVDALSFRVVYTSTSDSDLPTVIKNLTCRTFVDSEVVPIIEAAGQGVVSFWLDNAAAPDQSVADSLVGLTGSVAGYSLPKTVYYNDYPSFDADTQKVETTVTEDSTTIVYSYSVVALDSAELIAVSTANVGSAKDNANKEISELDTYLMTAMISGYNVNSAVTDRRLTLSNFVEYANDSDVIPPFQYDSAFLDSTNLTLPIDAYTKAEADKQLVQVYASWDGSTAGAYDWSTDELSSFGVDSVSRIQEGSFRVYFDTPFTDSNYTVTTGVGAENYGGTGASPRQLTVIRSQMTPDYVTVHCERTDDAVDEDNEYLSVIVMGTQ